MKSHLNKTLSTVAACVALQGCVSIYKAPAGAPTATLELTSNRTAFVQHFLNEACDKSPNGSRISFMHDSAGDPTGLTVKTIEAEKPFIFSMSMNTPQGDKMAYCNITGAFTPERNAIYRANFTFDGAKKMCVVQLSTRDQKSGVTSIEPSFKQLPVRCKNNLDG